MANNRSINTELVIKYLSAYSSISSGVTQKDLQAATGVSKSSISRILSTHPAIIRLEMPGREAKYYLDHNVVLQAMTTKQDDDGRVPLIKVDQAFITKVEQYTPVEFSKALARWDLEDSRAKLSKAIINSHEFQRGKDSIDPQVMREARAALDNLIQFSATMIAYCRMVKQHPEYLSDTEWWAIWPKD